MAARSLIATALVVSLSLIGCVDASTEDASALSTRTGPISGGYDSSGDRAVVGIVNIGNGGLGICSGTLIAPNLVLTAQHCIAPTLNEVQNGVSCSVTRFGTAFHPGTIFITTEPQLSQNPAIYVGVDAVLTPPDGLSSFCGRDVAMLVLNSSVLSANAAPIVPRVDSILRSNAGGGEAEVYSAVGFGNTSGDGGGSGQRRRRDDLSVQCVHAECPSFAVAPTEWIGQDGVCSGDSGGPALDADGRVIGVVSRGGADCDFPVYGSVYAWSDWIITTALSAAESGGYEAPLWAQGWPTSPSFYAPVGAPCEANSVCGDGFCIGGICTRACNAFAQCPSGYGCDGGRCSVRPGFTCTYEGCELIAVGDGCEIDDHCPEGRCRDGYCTRPCDDVAVCPNGYACADDTAECALIPVGGQCGDVADAVDCGAGTCGDEGLCTRACDDLAPCPSGFSCDGGQCRLTAVGGLCEDDRACGDGQCGGDGQCTRACSDLAPCPDGYLCGETGQCAEIIPPKTPEGCQGGGEPGSIVLALLLVTLALRRRTNVSTVRS